MSSKTIKAKFAYADATTRIYTINIDHIGDTSQELNAFASNAVTRANAINTAAENTSSSVAQTFVSNNGARLTKITELSIVFSDEEVIYNGGE